ncbi:MAG: hypothetical protein U0559_09170 [Anaerolineae bacterium]
MSELPPSQPTVQRNSGAWVGAIVLIGLGVIFLLQNFNVLNIGNWWALFILLGTAGAWGSAWRIYQNNGQRITPAVTGAFIGGLFPLAVALIFLFNMNWGVVWPIFLVIAGIAVLARSFGTTNN